MPAPDCEDGFTYDEFPDVVQLEYTYDDFACMDVSFGQRALSSKPLVGQVASVTSAVVGLTAALKDLDLDLDLDFSKPGKSALQRLADSRRWAEPQSCRNEREEARRRLAMGDDDVTGHEGSPGQGQSRLQQRLTNSASGMQICFMNDELDDLEDDVTTTDDVTTQGDTEQPQPPAPNHPCYPGELAEFTARQTQLQSEATLALAQASTMARMQLEVERQAKKKSPVADMVGIPSLGGGRRLRLTGGKLQEMNIAQLQVLVNDLHTQIELLNEDLVHQLIQRDDLHMEQDSMLVDIEDLTSHCHDPKTTNNNKSTQNNNRPTGRRGQRK